MYKILVVDDEETHCEVLSLSLARLGVKAICCYSYQDAIKHLSETKFSVVLTDLNLNTKETGIDIVKKVTESYPDTPAAVMSAYGDTAIALEALKLGAFDFINKPITTVNLRQIIEKAIGTANIKLIQDCDSNKVLSTLIGESQGMQELKRQLIKLARSQAPVFIHGESGTGKEVIANAIHKLSGRADGPFVPINCGAIPFDLMESELFGHKKGSFTGATNDKPGLIALADGGTLFLDEVADLPKLMQVKLLRTLQEKKIRPIGSDVEVSVDFRVISATHQDMHQSIITGNFREDLFFRLHVMDVYSPALRERGTDILLLAEHFCAVFCTRIGVPVKALSDDVRAWLQEQPFKGNVRELSNKIERAIYIAETNQITRQDFINTSRPKIRPAVSAVDGEVAIIPDEGLEPYLDGLEKNLIEEAMKKTNGNKTKAANILKISLRSLRYRLDKHNGLTG